MTEPYIRDKLGRRMDKGTDMVIKSGLMEEDMMETGETISVRVEASFNTLKVTLTMVRY